MREEATSVPSSAARAAAAGSSAAAWGSRKGAWSERRRAERLVPRRSRRHAGTHRGEGIAQQLTASRGGLGRDKLRARRCHCHAPHRSRGARARAASCSRQGRASEWLSFRTPRQQHTDCMPGVRLPRTHHEPRAARTRRAQQAEWLTSSWTGLVGSREAAKCPQKVTWQWWWAGTAGGTTWRLERKERESRLRCPRASCLLLPRVPHVRLPDGWHHQLRPAGPRRRRPFPPRTSAGQRLQLAHAAAGPRQLPAHATGAAGRERGEPRGLHSAVRLHSRVV